jgi:hypothetical protein
MNCLSGAILAWLRLGGSIRYRLPRPGNPFGHWWLEVRGHRVSWVATLPDRKMVWWRQLIFKGRFKREVEHG